MTTFIDLARKRDAIPVVASDTERDALFPFPDVDQRVHNKSLGVIQRYTANAGWQVDFTASAGGGGGGGSTLSSDTSKNIMDPAYGGTGLGAGDETPAFNAAIAAIPATGGELFLPAGTYNIDNVILNNRVNLTIRGEGDGTILRLTGNKAVDALDHYGFLLQGTTRNIVFRNLRFTSGIGAATAGQNAISTKSDATISDIRVFDCTFENVNTGVVFYVTTGSFAGGLISNCRFKDIKGTGSGAGYGVNLTRAYQTRVIGNLFDNCGRHACYQAKTDNGVPGLNVIAFNQFVNHRKDVFDGAARCALVISRSSGVVAFGNTFKDGYDGAIEVSHSTADPDPAANANCTDIQIFGNQFYSRQNAVPYMVLGEQAVPATYMLKSVLVEGNHFLTDHNTVDFPPDIVVWNGQHITIKGNTFRHRNSNTAVARRAIGAGHPAYGSSTAHINHIVVDGNDFTFEGADLTDTRCVDVDTPLATTEAILDITNNSGQNIVYMAYWSSARTNKTARYFGNVIPDYSGIVGNGFSIGYARIYQGDGSPEGAVTAPPGSVYLRSGGGVGVPVIYAKESGTGNTGWVSK